MEKRPRLDLSQKQLIVKEVIKAKLTIGEGARRFDVNKCSLWRWLADPKINENWEALERYNESRKGPRLEKRFPDDPFPEGVVMAARNNPDELARENKDLRKKVAYLEDKVAYLETLYSILKEDPAKISKKKDLRPSTSSSSREDQT